MDLMGSGVRDYDFFNFVLSFKTQNFPRFDSFPLQSPEGLPFCLFPCLRKYAFHRVPLQIFVLLSSSSHLPGYLLIFSCLE